MANYSDCEFKITAKHIFQLKKIKDSIEEEASRNSSQIAELINIDVDAEDLSLKAELVGKWSVDFEFFRKISEEVECAEFIDMEAGSNFFECIRHKDGEETDNMTGEYLGEEHMAALSEDGDSIWEEILSIAEDEESYSEYVQKITNTYWNQYGGDIDDIEKEIIEHIKECETRFIRKQKELGGVQ